MLLTCLPGREDLGCDVSSLREGQALNGREDEWSGGGDGRGGREIERWTKGLSQECLSSLSFHLGHWLAISKA